MVQTSMDQLSLKKYGWKCVLGGEVVYSLCLLSGFLPYRTEPGEALHRLLFQTLPGFQGIDVKSVILGAVYIFVFSWIFAWYYVWMHNSSMESK